jgi:polyisoprenoid-binding protein YceI
METVASLTGAFLDFLAHTQMRKTLARLSVFLLLAQWLIAQPPSSHQVLLHLDPTKSTAEITLAGNMHTVEGSFQCKHGTIQYDPTSGKASGEIVFDATSGKTGNSSRDKKMHKDVIESERFPEITFHPDRADGILARSGESTLQVHGTFSIHGADHEVTIPVQMNLQGSSWTANASFTVPYTKWGMKNPTVLFLRVDDNVMVKLHTAGSLSW